MEKNKNELEEICFRCNDINLKFSEGWNCYGLTIRGPLDGMQQIKNDKVLDGYKYKESKVTDDIIEFKIMPNNLRDAFISTVKTQTILLKYPFVKLATFWEACPEYSFTPLIYVLYSESGTSRITKCKCVGASASDGGDNNPFKSADVTDSNKKTFKYEIEDYHSGMIEKCKETYAFPYVNLWNDGKYANSAVKNDIIDLEAEAKNVNEVYKKFIKDEKYRNEVNNKRDLMLLLVKHHGDVLHLLSSELQDDEEIVLTAVESYKYFSRISGEDKWHISKRLNNDKDFAKKVIEKDPDMFCFFQNFNNDKDFMEHLLLISDKNADGLSDSLKDDKDFVLNIIKKTKDASIIENTSDRIKHDREFILEAAKYNELSYLPRAFSEDKEVILAYGKNNYNIIDYLSEELKNNKEFMTKLVALNPTLNIRELPSSLKNDKDFALYLTTTLKDDLGWNLQYLSDKLRDDEEVVLAAMTNWAPSAIKYASDRLKNDKEFILKLMNQNIKVDFSYISKELCDDEKVLLKGLKTENSNALVYMSDRLRNDKTFVIKAIELDESALCFFSNFNDDEEIVKYSISKNPDSIKYASTKLRKKLKNEIAEN